MWACGYDGALGLAVVLPLGGSACSSTSPCTRCLACPISRVKILEGYFPTCSGEVEPRSLDAIVCNNVIEHLWEPATTLRELHRVLAPGGRLVVNVPSWRGKFFLELAAFRLGLAPKQEMDDHKTYYDPRELWPLLIACGLPSEQRHVPPAQVRAEHNRACSKPV